jgi:predicted nucleic acid-binding protein
LIILDASAAVDLLAERGDEGEWVAGVLVGEDNVAAPHVFDLEVFSALRQLVARGELLAVRAEEAVAGLKELRIVRYPVVELLDRIWQLRDRLTPYDASYVALSETLRLPLVTTDRRLARSEGHRAEIVGGPF